MVEAFERKEAEKSSELDPSSLQELNERLDLFRKGLSKTDDGYLRYNARVLAKIINHLAKALDVEPVAVLERCSSFKDKICIEKLRDDLFLGF